MRSLTSVIGPKPDVPAVRMNVRPRMILLKRPQTVVSILRTLAALEIAKIGLRDIFWGHSIFDFCNRS
jgi:hypothetical protein